MNNLIVRRTILHSILIVQCVVLPILISRYNISSAFLLPTQVLILSVFIYLRSQDSQFCASFHQDWKEAGCLIATTFISVAIYGIVSYFALGDVMERTVAFEREYSLIDMKKHIVSVNIIGIIEGIAIFMNIIFAFVLYCILDINLAHNGYFKDEDKNIGVFKG